MTEIELAWLAGILEGEGSFGFDTYQVKYVKIRITLGMTDVDVVKRVALLFGGKNFCSIKRKPPCKMIYTTQLVGNQAADLMCLLLPFMGERRTQKINEVLVAWDNRKLMRRPGGLPNICHPDLPHCAHGLCRNCYRRSHVPPSVRKRRKHTVTRGETHPMVVLTEGQVREIRAFPRRRGIQQDLAKQYGVSQPAISAIVTGRTWKHLL